MWAGNEEEREDSKRESIALSSKAQLINKRKNKEEKNSRKFNAKMPTSRFLFTSDFFFLSAVSFCVSFDCRRGLLRAQCVSRTSYHVTAIRLFLYPSASPLVSTAAPSLTGALADFGPCPSCALPRRKDKKRLELTCFVFCFKIGCRGEEIMRNTTRCP